MQQSYSTFRCRSGSKPSVQKRTPKFYCCRECAKTAASYDTLSCPPKCCEKSMEEIEPRQLMPGEEGFDYQIIGGYDQNGIQVYWPEEYCPEWIWLHTFSGGQLKFVPEGKVPPVTFALAEEDAYAYCDEDPCLECVFRCKKGFLLYFYVPEMGLLTMPMDRLKKYWEK